MIDKPIANKVFFSIDKKAVYPSNEWSFSPSQHYPEYPHTEIAKEENKVYEMIREGFASLGFDKENYGTPLWNPLGSIIKPGQTVLLKPNWVIDLNREPNFGDMDCLVTHPSIIRAVLDYVYIALGNEGEIFIADAPIQLCNFEELHKKMHYNFIWEFYRRKNIKINVVDLRGLVATQDNNKIFNTSRNIEDGIVVRIDSKSCFYELNSDQIDRFRITNYDPRILSKHHNKDKHEYMINPIVLKADVIINLPKPKTHKKAGLTACAKNFVGTCMRKEYLPHHTMGSKTENGDEYFKKSILRKLAASLLDLYNICAYEKRKFANILRLLSVLLTRFSIKINKDHFSEGGWYGNDTIWRTIVDLNNIVLKADKEGKMREIPQRKIFHICDMIVSGEKEGPLEPSPKKLGALVMGENAAVVDWFICLLMGFKIEAIRYIERMLEEQDLKDPSQVLIIQKDGALTTLREFSFEKEWRFVPTLGWKGHIEKN